MLRHLNEALLRIYTLMIIGEILMFRTARSAAQRILNWKSSRPAELGQLRRGIRRSIVSMLDASGATHGLAGYSQRQETGAFLGAPRRMGGALFLLNQTSRITGMMSGRRWVCLFKKRFKSVRIFSCITPQSPRSSAVDDSRVRATTAARVLQHR